MRKTLRPLVRQMVGFARWLAVLILLIAAVLLLVVADCAKPRRLDTYKLI